MQLLLYSTCSILGQGTHCTCPTGPYPEGEKSSSEEVKTGQQISHLMGKYAANAPISTILIASALLTAVSSTGEHT